MNLYEKLQQMRVDLQQKNIKKSGRNTYSGYDYYELADILPPINELQNQYKTCSCIRFNKEEAVLTIINSEKITKDFYTGFKKEHTNFAKFITGIDDHLADKDNKNNAFPV